jgi:DNA polymerase-3 subunit beta
MKINVGRSAFQAAFRIASLFSMSRSYSSGVIDRILLSASGGSAQLIATDHEVSIALVVLGAEVESEGDVLLPRDRFGAVLREVPDDNLVIESTGNSVLAAGSHSEFIFSTEDPREFPLLQLSEYSDEHFRCEMQSHVLCEMIRRTIFAASKAEGLYSMQGALIEWGEEYVTAVATDGRRMACMKAPAIFIGEWPKKSPPTIVPARSLSLIESALRGKAGDVRLSLGLGGLVVVGHDVRIRAGLLEGRFPSWREVIKEGGSAVDIPAGVLSSAVRQAAIVTSRDLPVVHLKFERGTLSVSARDSIGDAMVHVPVDYDGTGQEIAVNPYFLTDFLGTVAPERVLRVRFINDSTPLMFEDGWENGGAQAGCIYLVMPRSE